MLHSWRLPGLHIDDFDLREDLAVIRRRRDGAKQDRQVRVRARASAHRRSKDRQCERCTRGYANLVGDPARQRHRLQY